MNVTTIYVPQLEYVPKALEHRFAPLDLVRKVPPSDGGLPFEHPVEIIIDVKQAVVDGIPYPRINYVMRQVGSLSEYQRGVGYVDKVYRREVGP